MSKKKNKTRYPKMSAAAKKREAKKRYLSRPDTPIKLLRKIMEISKTWKKSYDVSKRIQNLVSNYYKSLEYRAKTKKSKELYKNILQAKKDRWKAYANAREKKLEKGQVFPSYTTNYTNKIFDRLDYLKNLYPDEYDFLKQFNVDDKTIERKLKDKALIQGKLVPLKQGEQYGYIDEDQGLVWSGE